MNFLKWIIFLVLCVNVWIQGFDVAKVESNNKVVSTNIQRLSIASRIIQGQSKQDQEKDKS